MLSQVREFLPDHPDTVQTATREWRMESDVILRYWTERIEPHRESHVMSKELMADLNQFLDGIGQQAWSQKTAADRLSSHEQTKKNKIEKAVIRKRAGLSRPTGDAPDGWTTARPEPPAQYTAWLGMRFTAEADSKD